MSSETPYLIKICGNRFFEDSLRVAAFRPDFMGWIFSPKSPRRISVAEARPQLRAIRAAFPGIKHVAVFASNPVPEMARIAGELPEIDLLQMVGSPGLVESYRRYIGAGFGYQPVDPRRRIEGPAAIMPAVRVGAPVTESDLERYGRVALFQVDSYVRGVPGGTGHRLESRFIEHIRRPFLLAGGLRPENVTEALAATNAAGVDVSSGLEDPGWPGRKNEEKLANFITAVRALK